ncbi:amidohydrolase family protein [Reichenbachiella agarivorans]|uniref:Amidohydrolase family protein n=1 Tax=Reichenbachiella agarivorans TaxID=2979464 RepID=A0ABY6CPJ9_9BACT|nr:amidohydrolase family protein [Reichenbachiella agarivorans]UXP32454.1 amidohydrolase family protein [Reichenbachiella agarivorans]
MKHILTLALLLLSLLSFGQNMEFEDYNPPSTLVVNENLVRQAKFPFIDVHNHQWSMDKQNLSQLIKEMDELNMAVMVNLSGRGQGSTQYLHNVLDNVHNNYPNRFIIFTNIDFENIDKPNWTKNAVKTLEEDVKAGANGLKIYKSLGLRYTDSNGNRIKVDDPRIDPIWAKCGELGIPVLIHSADPKPFWDEHDANNERWLELKTKPNRKRSDTDPAPWETIIAEQHHVFAKHPKTKFINAHLGWYANDLTQLGQIMDRYPNMYSEIGAVIAELGRQPKTARAFFEKYQDRIMFGKDYYNQEEYYTYFRVLETEDEYFPYYKKYHAYWKMYGLGLSDQILKKLYYQNALKVIPNIDTTLFTN